MVDYCHRSVDLGENSPCASKVIESSHCTTTQGCTNNPLTTSHSSLGSKQLHHRLHTVPSIGSHPRQGAISLFRFPSDYPYFRAVFIGTGGYRFLRSFIHPNGMETTFVRSVTILTTLFDVSNLRYNNTSLSLSKII